MLKIIIDGSADMPEGWAETYHFNILPIPIQIGNKTYYQGEDITPELFYEMVANTQNHPSTAAPSHYRIKSFIENICDMGDTVLSINVSGKMSSTVSMVILAARELKDKINVNVFDSGAGSVVLAFMAREARLREQAGKSLEEIIECLKVIRDKSMVILTLDNLEFAHRSGRVGKLQTALSSFLNIKPIISLNSGKLDVSHMVRTRKKSLEYLVEKVRERFGQERIRVAIVHSQDENTAKQIKEMMEGILNIAETIFTELSISVAANLGPKTVGIVAFPENI